MRVHMRACQPGGSGRGRWHRVLTAVIAWAMVFGSGMSFGSPVSAVEVCDGVTATIVGSGTINGTRGDDVIVGSAGSDTIQGNGGNDIICSGDGDDIIFGGSGNDRLFGQRDSDKLYGDAGNDFLSADETPTSGSPLYIDFSSGGTGNDVIEVSGSYYCNLNNPAICDSEEHALGDTGNDIITGTGHLEGGAGDDQLRGLGQLDGGSGNDSVVVTGELFGLDRSPYGTGYGGSGRDTITIENPTEVDDNIMQLFGGSSTDTCTAASANVVVHDCEVLI